jgi:hypothetical protein
MPYFFTTSVTQADTEQYSADSLRISKSRYAMLTEFKPLHRVSADGTQGVLDTSLGVYAEISVPESSDISSVAVRLHDRSATGVLYLSPVNPQESYDGFFLYTFLSDIMPTNAGPSMYRKTEIHPGAYNTSVVNERKIYALILNGPEINADGIVIKADVAITSHSA